MFGSANGGRNNASKIIVLFVDNPSVDQAACRSISKNKLNTLDNEHSDKQIFKYENKVMNKLSNVRNVYSRSCQSLITIENMEMESAVHFFFASFNVIFNGVKKI